MSGGELGEVVEEEVGNSEKSEFLKIVFNFQT